MNKLKKFFILYFNLFFICTAISGYTSSFYDTGSEKLVKKEKIEKKPFYQTKEEGWYFYKEALEEEKKKKEEETALKEKKENRKPQPKSMEELWAMYPDDFHEYERKSLKYAVHTGDPKDVEQYLKVLEVAKAKAEQFSNVVTYVGYKNPEMYMKENYSYPTNTPGLRANMRTKENDILKTINTNKHDFGLIILTQPGCEACNSQQDVLDYFYNKYQWVIQDFDITEKPFLIEKFKIRNTPTTILISKKTKETHVVGAGITTLEMLENNIYKGIKILSGETNPQMFNMYDYQMVKNKENFSKDNLLNLLKKNDQ